MSPHKKPRRVLAPIEIFRENLADAEQLVRISRMLEDQRQRPTRSERKETLGRLLVIPKAVQHEIECAESDSLFIVLKPGGEARKGHFTPEGAAPLLRQAVVAISAAVESYIADKACEYITQVLDLPDEKIPARLNDFRPGFKDLIVDIVRKYDRPLWGYREMLKDYLHELASPAPLKIGVTFSTVGVKVPWAAIDQARGRERGTSEKDLNDLYKRRNLIAHQADRKGSTQSRITREEVEGHLERMTAIIEALEANLPGPASGTSGESRSTLLSKAAGHETAPKSL